MGKLLENKSDRSNFIIGGGPSGLLAGYFLKDFKIIARNNDIGGQLKVAPFQLGPRFIRDNKKFRKLLKDLRISHSIQTTRIGYFDGDNFLDSPSAKFTSQYIKKTRNSNSKSKNFMNDNLSRMKIIGLNMNDLIEKLRNSLEPRLINNLVKKIDIKKKQIVLDDNRVLNYDKLISTIHYKEFCKLARIKCILKFNDIYFYFMPGADVIFDLYKDYDFIYIATDKVKYNRITFLENGYVLESPIKLSKKEMLVDGITDFYVLKNSKLNSKYKIQKIKDVIQLGRYAQLDSEIRIHNLIDKIQEIKNGL